MAIYWLSRFKKKEKDRVFRNTNAHLIQSIKTFSTLAFLAIGRKLNENMGDHTGVNNFDIILSKS